MPILLNATTKTLVDFLNEQLISDAEIGAKFRSGELVASPETPQAMRGRQQGISVWLYRINPSTQTRRSPTLVAGNIASTMLALYYLVTPIVDHDDSGHGPILEQYLLSAVMQALHGNQVITGEQLRGELSGKSAGVSIRQEPLTLDELSRVWHNLDTPFTLSASYEVSLVPVNNS